MKLSTLCFRLFSVATIVTLCITYTFAGKALAAKDIDEDYDKLRQKLLERYTTVIDKLEASESSFVSVFVSEKMYSTDSSKISIIDKLKPWWTTEATNVINPNLAVVEDEIETLFTKTLANAPQIKVFADLPMIRETTIQEAEGPFDVTVFADGRLADIDEPVGDDLRTGGPNRYEEQSHTLEYGVQKKFITGTEVELKQRIGDMDTNSTYFNPIEQARAGTFLTIRQPLLKGFGISYQEAPITLAQIDTNVSKYELQRQVESHLLEVVRAYWGLYLERTLFLQKRRLAKRTEEILNEMEGRKEVDVTPALLARARSLVKAHELGAYQAEFAMRNAQSKIRALVHDPTLLQASGVELVTTQLPTTYYPVTPFGEVLQAALENRSEIAQSVGQIQAAMVREMRTSKELMPTLDFFFDTYVKGLEGDYDYNEAYSNQFDEGDPSYLVGLRLEYPLGNNGAEARNTRKKIAIRQLINQLDVTVENVMLEVQVSHREMQKYYESMVQSYQIMKSDMEEINEIMSRIDYLVEQGEPYGDMLYRLMDSSERLTRSEETVARSELTYNLALYNLQRAMGVMVQNNDIAFAREEDDDELPILRTSQVSGEGTRPTE